jgi:lipopolysaccharide export system protein LptA
VRIIWADSLSVSEKNRTATFSGHVVVTRGDARLQCASVVVHHNGHGVIDRFECKPDRVRLAD